MRDAATALRKAACLLDQAADRADPPTDTGELPVATECAPADLPGALANRPAGSESPAARPGEAETSPVRAGAGGPEGLRAAPVPSSTETSMNHIAPQPEAAIREIPLSCLALAPENVRKTPPDAFADHQLRASIAAHGLLENLVARADEPNESGAERFAVVAGGRRLAALKALAEDGTLDVDHPVPCKIAANGDAGELSLAENMIRIAMHPADQVVAFSTLAASGVTATAIAARFGVTERIVEQRLRLGNAAPELLDAYRAEAIDLETLKAFAVTTDHERQLAVWEQVSAQGYRPSAWQVKRMLTEERVPAGSAMARFVGVDAYEAAGGPALRDLFADEHENGVWLEDPALLNDLAMKKLQGAADELATRWKWAESVPEVDCTSKRGSEGALKACTAATTGGAAAHERGIRQPRRMKDTAVIVVLVLLLASSHVLLSSRTVRARLVAQLGEKPFLAAYSVVALVFFVPLVLFYRTHRHLGPQLWSVPATDTVQALLILANATGVVMLVAGVMDPGPGSFFGKPREEPIGIHRITRHPVFMGMSVMAVVHAIANGHASDVAFFGGLAVFSLAGCGHQDR